jgi:hypothetical protein
VDVNGLMESRWRGQRGRLEVWYTTLTDPVTGTGLWLHHELVAPSDGASPYAHGWAALFPKGEAPVLARFGRAAWTPPGGGTFFASSGVTVGRNRLSGEAGELAWALSVEPGGPPLYPFPRWAWRRELLPAAQVVPQPGARFTGTVRCGHSTLRLDRALGATARVYGHGNAHAWGWVHADLGGGDVLEAVAAVSTRPGLRRLRPLTFLRLRLAGRDWPAIDPLLTSPLLRARLGRPQWSISGRVGGRRILVEVTMLPAETVSVPYQDPDGAAATCHNSERADATIRLEHRRAGAWVADRRWELSGTAHAEIGERGAAEREDG